MLVGPITTTVVDPQTGQKMTSQEFARLRKQGKIKPGIYPYSAPGLGHSAEYRLVPFLNELPSDEKLRAEALLDSLFKEILHRNPVIAENIELLFDKNPAFRFYAIQHLQRIQISGPSKYVIFNALLEAKAPFCLWHCDSTEELRRLLRTYGRFLANVPYINGFNGLSQCFMQPSELGLGHNFHKFGLLVQFGADLNHMHPRYGTVFHTFTADEAEDIAIQLLELCKMLGKIPNLNLRDFEGKTVLFLAAKTRQYQLVNKLITFKKEGWDVDLDLPDNQGRTAIMISAALGDWESFEALIEAGANTAAIDNQGRDLKWYVNAGVEIINTTLLEINIEPERDSRTKSNWLSFNDEYALPMVCAMSKEKHKRVLNSSLPLHRKLIEEILRISFHNKPLQKYIMKQIAGWYGKLPSSMQSVCLEGKAELRARLNAKLRMHCALGNIREVRKYYAIGAYPSATDKLNRNAFHYCVMRQNMVQTIQSRFPAYHSRSIQDCMEGHVTCFTFLLETNGNLFQRNTKNNTVEDILRRDRIPHAEATELDTQTAQTLFFVYWQHIFSSGARGILVGDPGSRLNQLPLGLGIIPDLVLSTPLLESNEPMLIFDVRRSFPGVQADLESVDLELVPSLKRLSFK